MGGHLKRNPKLVIQEWLGRGRREDAYFRRVLRGCTLDERGQSTVEYAVIMAAMLCVIAALGMLGNAVDGGMFVQHAVAAASHNLQGMLGGVADVFSY